MPPNPGPRRFQFLREIASGGFGSVYLAKVIHSDGFSRLVAVKLLHKRWSENDEVASRMRDEARLLGWLRHRNIVEVLDLTFIDGRSAVVMEYLEAIDAKGMIERCAATRVEVPVPVVCEFGAATASALDAAYNRPPYAGEKPLRVIHVPVTELALVLQIALRFVPTLMDQTTKIMNAQRARGVDFGTGNLFQQMKAVVPLLIPLFVDSFGIAEDLATAMDARGYQGGDNRTKYRVLKYHRSDVTAAVVMAALTGLLVFLRA